MIFILNNAFHRKVHIINKSTPIFSLLYTDTDKDNIFLEYTNLQLKYHNSTPIHVEYYNISIAVKNYISNKLMYVTVKPCVLCINMLISQCVKKIIYMSDYSSLQSVAFTYKHNMLNLLKSFYVKLRLK